MWKCPKCGRDCEGDRCSECGIENLNGKVKNIVGSQNDGEYFMVSADFFKKKTINKWCLAGFILAIIAAVTWVWCCIIGFNAPSKYPGCWWLSGIALGIAGMPAIICSIIGIRKFDKNTQRGYKFAKATIHIVGITFIITVSLLAGLARGYDYSSWYRFWYYEY